MSNRTQKRKEIEFKTEVNNMISFPIDEYVTYRKDAPAPEWMTGERMNYCEQPEINERNVLDCISEFFINLF